MADGLTLSAIVHIEVTSNGATSNRSMIFHILEAQACGPHSLRLTFSDGTRKRVNLWSLLDGPVFEPLRDPAYFARVVIDPVAGTVVWPNEADFAPEALYELEAEEEPASEPIFISGRALSSGVSQWTR